jgi:hypothetical protein
MSLGLWSKKKGEEHEKAEVMYYARYMGGVKGMPDPKQLTLICVFHRYSLVN